MKTTILFHKGARIIGVLSLPSGVGLTPAHVDKLAAVGIGVLVWRAPTAEHDGKVNQYVDTLLETGACGQMLPLIKD